MFFDGARRQVVIEAGGRTHKDAIALGGRLQQAFGKHTIIQIDTFVAGQEERSVGAGARTEVMFKF
jgi:predicted NBD/HSP70 family sugar kinase